MNGLCECGCGQKTAVSKVNHRPRGWVRGTPVRFIKGHSGRARKPMPLDLERLLILVKKTESCWAWTGRLNDKGYGLIDGRGERARRPLLAHRISWILHIGPVQKGMCICHHCDNPCCVRPSHLFVGTIGDNNRDAAQKGHFSTERRKQAGRENLKKANEVRLRNARFRGIQI